MNQSADEDRAETTPAMSDDEADEDSMAIDTESAEQTTGKSKKDRTAELQKMMDMEGESDA